jgi:hypothetical protein
MAEIKTPPIVEGDVSDTGNLPETIRDAAQQFVVALAQRLNTSKPVVAEKLVTCGLDIMLARLGPEVVAHWLRRCADQVEAMQVKPPLTAVSAEAAHEAAGVEFLNKRGAS